MIKRSVYPEDTTIINIYTPNIGTLKYIKQILRDQKGEIDNNAIIVEDFNIPLPAMTTDHPDIKSIRNVGI